MTDAADIVSIFNDLFIESHHTCLVGDAAEPLYEPASETRPARIIFKEDFVASALHELAHWCIAGHDRRKQVDYGYWYEADRAGEAQSRFEQAEVIPQGMEWVLSVAAGVPFRVSVDNLVQPHASSCQFRRRVQIAALDRVRGGLPQRALTLAAALSDLPDGNPDYLDEKYYKDMPPL
jgi:elongation factor P hydroxylase